MAGIQNSILNTNTANTVQLRWAKLNTNESFLNWRTARRQLEEKNKTIKKLKEDRSTANPVTRRRTVGQEINLLKTFLNDKISSINQMKDELKYKDIDSNTIDGVRNVNELGKSDSNL